MSCISRVRHLASSLNAVQGFKYLDDLTAMEFCLCTNSRPDNSQLKAQHLIPVSNIVREQLVPDLGTMSVCRYTGSLMFFVLDISSAFVD